MIFFSSNLVKLDLDLDSDPDLDPHSEKLLDPDPLKMNADPQPCGLYYRLPELSEFGVTLAPARARSSSFFIISYTATIIIISNFDTYAVCIANSKNTQWEVAQSTGSDRIKSDNKFCYRIISINVQK